MARKYKMRKYKKKRRSKKKDELKRVTYWSAKRIPVSRIAKRLSNTTYDFVRWTETEQIIGTNDFGFTSSSINFTLQKLVLPGEFTSLFDHYQIVKCEVMFTPDIQQVNQLIGSTNVNAIVMPRIYVFRDLDNTGTITEDSAKERTDVIMKSATERFNVSVVPQVNRTVYRTESTSAKETPYKLVWLDCTQNDVPHYGLRFGITGSGSSMNNVTFDYTISARYWIRFRSIR